MDYKCRKCGADFKSFHFLLLPVCERCKREQAAFKDSKSNKDSSNGGEPNTAVAVVVVVGIGFLIWVVLKGWGMMTYWDKVYVPDAVNTYSSQEFKSAEKVEYSKDDRIVAEVTVYNIKTGDDKEIEISLPLHKIWTREVSREKLDGSKEIIAYKQPLINDGYDFIKPSDVVIEDSDGYKAIVQKASIVYRGEHATEFADWTFNKDEVKK